MDFFTRIYLDLVNEDLTTLLYVFMIPALVIALIIMEPRLNPERKKQRFIICAVPFIICVVFICVNYIRGDVMTGILRYISQLMIAAIFLLCSFWTKDGKMRRCSKVVTITCTCLLLCGSILYINGLSSITHLGNYSRAGWSEAVEGIIDDTEKNYSLRDWKEIDFNGLRKKYVQRAKKAEENHDEVAYGVILQELCYEFQDAHVFCMYDDIKVKNQIADKMLGNDYGFSMIQLANGDVEAFLVDDNSEAFQKGIKTGVKITKWNNVPIRDALLDVKCISPNINYCRFPLAENEDKMKAIYLAGKGGQAIEVSFVDKEGKQMTESIQKIGNYSNRINRALNPFVGKTVGSENFSTKMLNNHCGYLVVNREHYDEWGDIWSSLTDDYPEVRDLVNDKLSKLQKQGMDRLIIDIRGNGGGYEVITSAVVSLFLDHEINLYTSPYTEKENGIRVPMTIKGDGRWKDLPVVVLVNEGCVSSGDHLANGLAACPNVTLMGMTNACGSAQSIGGVCILPDSKIEFHYPIYLDTTKDGKPYIDAKKDRKGSLVLDEVIDLNEKAIDEIFEKGKDYELQYAIDYISKK